MELLIACEDLIHNLSTELKPQGFNNYNSWQCGAGEHSNSKKAIVGSVELFVCTDSDQIIFVRHLVLQDLSGWVLGRNPTRQCNIIHIYGNALLLSNGDRLKQIAAGHHSCVLLDHFVKPDINSPSLSCPRATPSIGASEILNNWAKLHRVFARVNRHICGRVTYFDMRTLFMRNCIWIVHV